MRYRLKKAKKTFIMLIILLILCFIPACVKLNADNIRPTITLEKTDNAEFYLSTGQNGRTGKSAVLISAEYFSEFELPYKIQGGTPYGLYELSALIKTDDLELYNSKNTGLALMVQDESDYNSDYIFSDTINKPTSQTDGNENGWIKLTRIVKLDENGCLNVALKTTDKSCKIKGHIFVDKPSVVTLEETENYLIYTSDDSRVNMVFKKNDIFFEKANENTIIEWVNLYSKFRQSLKWLSGDFEPYEGITTYIFTENLNHYGLAGNPIYINSKYVKTILESIELDTSKENNDISWGLVHEMSHTFDGIYKNEPTAGYLFDSELIATLKCIYALYDNGYGMGNDMYVGKDVVEHFGNSDFLSKGIYNAESIIYRLLNIINSESDPYGWNAIRYTLTDLREHNITQESEYEIFIQFIDTLSTNSNINIKEQFTEEEWKTLINHF